MHSKNSTCDNIPCIRTRDTDKHGSGYILSEFLEWLYFLVSLIIFFESTTYTFFLELLLFVGVDIFRGGEGTPWGISTDNFDTGGVGKDDLR